MAVIEGCSKSQVLNLLKFELFENPETCHRQKEIPKLLNQLELNHNQTSAIELTQFPQSHNVRKVSAFASGIATAQKYEASVRWMRLDVRVSNPASLLILDSYLVIRRLDTDSDSHASDSCLIIS